MNVNNFDLIRTLLKFEDKDDFYFLQIIQRKKDGNLVPSANNGYRTIKTYYIRSLEDFDRRKEAIIQLCEQNNARAYINLNVRSAKEVALEAAKAYIDLVREDRCHQGHRVYDHTCGVTPKMSVKKKWIVDVDDLTPEQIDIICEKICKCRSAYPMENPDPVTFDNIIAEIPTAHGVHIITHGFDVGRFREILEQTTSINLTKEQIKKLRQLKKIIQHYCILRKIMGSKSTRTVRVHLPVQDEIDINKYARDAACSIFLQGDFYDILKLSHKVEIIEKILRKLNVIVTHDKFSFEYLDNDENSIDKLKMFNSSFKIIDEDYLEQFLDEHDYKDADEDSYYNIRYECSDEYILVDMPKWTILIRNILKTK